MGGRSSGDEDEKEGDGDEINSGNTHEAITSDIYVRVSYESLDQSRDKETTSQTTVRKERQLDRQYRRRG